ncbi:ParB/RepB/Spo0J family partition protein [Eubacterium multiforme]|uniref:ParB-like N-terminal domain-containing protein n=1 Tax=Eubacterium multiforme TaxID=83339 RepID=A0ABT9USF2_9FIRM|nr:ParB/RepB/Spo0J family partition protein [Eubacterium multiforme]MDQ0149234.1 hypothetical protein [Eubacterium multiforme]
MLIEIDRLWKHSRNIEFFDDMEGQKWEDFKKSIKSRGVIEPIVLTQDLLIVSGHQRVKACEELGIKKIDCTVKQYKDSEEKSMQDSIIEDLITTNIMQRGMGNLNPMKAAKCIMELERIWGIQNGGNRGNQYKVADKDNLNLPTQKDLADQLDISQQQLQDYKKLTKLIPELQDMVETKQLSATVGYKIWAKMPKEEQEKFFNEIGKDQISSLTQKATKEYIDKVKNLEEELHREKNKEPKVVEKVVEKIVDNTDYGLKNRNKMLEEELASKKRQLKNISEQKVLLKEEIESYKKDSDEYKKLLKDMDTLTQTREDLGRRIQGVRQTTALLCDVDDMLKLISPIKYSKAIIDVKDDEVVAENLRIMVNLVQNWCIEMNKLISNENNYIYAEVIEGNFNEVA